MKNKNENEKRKIKIGDLVKITTPSIGIPKGTIGLVLHSEFADSGFRYLQVHMLGVDRRMVGTTRRYLGVELELISEGG